jgi:hypothetical protein
MSYETFHFDNVAEPQFGIQVGPMDLPVHARSACAGRACCIHSPSDHHMREWPMNYRGDRGQTERMCPHGVGHPDPDDARWHESQGRTWAWNHGCDGCCHPPTSSEG